METIFLRDKNVDLQLCNFVERDTLNIDQPAIRNCFSRDSPLATKRGKGIFFLGMQLVTSAVEHNTTGHLGPEAKYCLLVHLID